MHGHTLTPSTLHQTLNTAHIPVARPSLSHLTQSYSTSLNLRLLLKAFGGRSWSHQHFCVLCGYNECRQTKLLAEETARAKKVRLPVSRTWVTFYVTYLCNVPA